MGGTPINTIHTEQFLLGFTIECQEIVVLEAPLGGAVLEQDLVDVETLAHPLPVLLQQTQQRVRLDLVQSLVDVVAPRQSRRRDRVVQGHRRFRGDIPGIWGDC